MVAHVYYINGCLTKFTPGGVIIPFSPDKFNSDITSVFTVGPKILRENY